MYQILPQIQSHLNLVLRTVERLQGAVILAQVDQV